MSFEIIFFFFIAVLSVGSALFMITRLNPMKSVLFLIVNFFCLAILYLTLGAQFIAIIEILVYAGAIMVLFLFVIMLLNLGDESRLVEKKSYKRLLALPAALILLIEIIIGLRIPAEPLTLPPIAAQMGSVEYIGKALYTEYVFPFEVTSLLLLSAIVGVIVLAKKRSG